MHSRTRQKSYHESWRAQEGKHCANSTPKPSPDRCEVAQLSSAAEDQQISSWAEHQENWVLLPPLPLVTQLNLRRVPCVYCAPDLCVPSSSAGTTDFRTSAPLLCMSSINQCKRLLLSSPGTAVLNKQQ